MAIVKKGELQNPAAQFGVFNGLPRPASADYRGLRITPELELTAGDEILVSGTYSEIAPARPSKADFAIRRAHKSALEERHVRGAGRGMC